jgi:PAS domain S-box-containing protein
VLENDQDGVVETVQYAKDGRRFVATVLLSAFKDDAGNTIHHFLSWADITRQVDAEADAYDLREAQKALHASEERQSFLLALGDAMRAQPDAKAVMEVAARMLGECLNASRIMFAEYDHENRLADIFHGWFADGAMPFPAVLRLDDFEGHILEDLRAGRTVRIDNTGPPFDKPDLAAVAELGVKALLSPPLIVNGTLMMNVSVHQHEPRHWTDNEVALVQEVSERLWAELARARTEAALRASEERYRELFERIDEGFCIIEVFFDDSGKAIDYLFVEINPAFERHTGISDAVGRRMRDIAPDHEEHWFSTYGEIARTGQARRLQAPAKQLGDRYYDLNAFRVGDPEQGLVAIIFNDISKRRRDEAALRQSTERLRLIVEGARDYAIFTMDSDRRITQWLPGAQAVFGWTKEEIEGRSGDILFTPEDREQQAPQTEAETALRDGIAADVRWHLHKDGRRVFIEGQVVPLDEGDDERGFLKIGQDVTARRAAQEALRESEERLRQFGEASQDILWIRDAETLAWTYLTPAFEAIYGLSREEALQGDSFRNWLELVVPEDREHARFMIDRVRGGDSLTFEYRIRRPADGQMRWVRDTDFPIRGEDGRIGSFGGIGQDITSMKAAEELLATSEERLRNAAEIAQIALWDWNVHTGDVAWSDEHFRMEGYEVGEVRPSYEAWIARIHPDDRDETEAAITQARDTRSEYVHEFRTIHPDGSVHWLSARGRFFYDSAGSPVRMIGAMLETTERREWEERQKVLVGELQHRTRNLMGVVRSMADSTARTSVDFPDFRERYRDRLAALARVQGLLSRLHEHNRVTFDELIRTEFSAMGAGPERVTLEGPTGVRLRSSTVQTLAMAVHELATNASKYGALMQLNGRLLVRWSFEGVGDAGKPWLHIEWRETGLIMPPIDAAPQGTGQGRELIEKALPYQLGARTSYKFETDGVYCTISVPVSATIAEMTDA